jgi:non-heme chloroperoxidase
MKLSAVTLANLFGVTRFNDATVIDFNVAPAQDERYVPTWSFNTVLDFSPGLWRPNAPAISRNKPVLVHCLRDDECFKQPLYEEAFASIAPHSQIVTAGHGGHWDLLVDRKVIAHIAAWLLTASTEISSDTSREVRRGRAA